ncbi:MAG TPA: SLBB domain-containing protein [Dehalococcoidia bacterium]|nr:SLBB domain-containing protein [Dehalococcoidia bacterium]
MSRSSRIHLAALALVFAVVFLVAAALLRPRAGAPVQVILLDPVETPVSLQAQISGAVAHPGIYPIRRGGRVSDLIAAAGGLLPDADLQQLNEARHVSDGDAVFIPALATPSAAAPLVRINHASRDELLTLPGMTVQQAGFIVASVRSKGPLSSADDLVQRRLVSQTQAAQIAPLVDWSR